MKDNEAAEIAKLLQNYMNMSKDARQILLAHSEALQKMYPPEKAQLVLFPDFQNR